jgi:hypothetical protein
MREMLERGGVPVAEELTTPGPWTAAQDNGGGGRNITAVVHGEEIRIGHTARVVFAGEEYVTESQAKHNADLFAASKDLMALARFIGSAYPNDPGTSDLDDEQPVTITLGTVRRAWRALAKVDGRVA